MKLDIAYPPRKGRQIGINAITDFNSHRHILGGCFVYIGTANHGMGSGKPGDSDEQGAQPGKTSGITSTATPWITEKIKQIASPASRGSC